MRKAEFVHLLRVNRARLPRRPKRVPMLPPDMAAARYLRRVKQTVLADAWAAVEKHLLPALPALALEAQKARGEGVERADAEGPDLGAILDAMVDEYFGKWTRRRFDRIVQPFGTTLAAFHAGQMNRVLHELVGVDVVGSEPWLADVLKAFTAQNVALIKTIPSTFFDEIEKLVTQGIAEGGRWEGMADDLRERYNVSESRAKLIARDQSGKLYGNLNRVRQTDLGIERYTWRSMRDNRVRDEHEARDGHSYTWDKPPAGGPPGQAIQCRCYADPDLEPILAEARGESSAAVGALAQEVAPEPEQEATPAKKPRAKKAVLTPLQKLEQTSEQEARKRFEEPFDRVRKELEAARQALLDGPARVAELEAEKVQVEAERAVVKAEIQAASDRIKALEAAGERSAARDLENSLTDAFDRSSARFSRLMAIENELLPLQYRVQNATGDVARLERELNSQKRTDFEKVQAEGKGPVRGPAGADVAREFPRVAEILGGRLHVDDLNDGVRFQMRELERLPPSMLAALKPHMGQITITKGTIRDRGRFTSLSDTSIRGPTSYDTRTSWDQVGGVATPVGGTGRAEVVVPDWQGATGENVMAHELSHILDGVLGGGSDYYSTGPKWRGLWEGFRTGADKLTTALGQDFEPANKTTGYFTNNEYGHVETFAEAFARYLDPSDEKPERLERWRAWFPDHAKRGDAYLTTAVRFGPKIADEVEKRVQAERWLKP